MKWNVLGLAAAGALALAGLAGCDGEARNRETRMNDRLDAMQSGMDDRFAAVNNEFVMLRHNPPVVWAPAPEPAPAQWQPLENDSESWRARELQRIREEERRRINEPQRAQTGGGGTLAAKHIRVNQPVTTVQRALQNHGYYRGAIDGKVGPQTIAAIQAFQRANGLAVDGVVGPRTWAALAG